MAKNERKRIIDDMAANDPAVLRGRRTAWSLILIWLISRALFLVSELLCVHLGFVERSALSLANVISFVLAVCFALSLLLYGTKPLALLMLLGGFMTVYRCFSQGAYLLLSYDLYPLVRAYVISSIVTGWLQLLCMALILLLPSCRSYLSAAAAAYKKGKQEPEGPHL